MESAAPSYATMLREFFWPSNPVERKQRKIHYKNGLLFVGTTTLVLTLGRKLADSLYSAELLEEAIREGGEVAIKGWTGEVETWGEVVQHVEVIPFYLNSSTHTYDLSPVRERFLSLVSGPISLHYHCISPESLPQHDYSRALHALPTEDHAEVIHRFLSALLWQQSAYFVFLIYDPAITASSPPTAIKREQFTYNLRLNDTQLTSEFLIVRLAYEQVVGVMESDLGRIISRYKEAISAIKSTIDPILRIDEHIKVLYPTTHQQLITEWESLSKDIRSARLYLEQRKYAKAGKFISAIENSQSVLRLLAARTAANSYSGAHMFYIGIFGVYAVLLSEFLRKSKGSSKAQV